MLPIRPPPVPISVPPEPTPVNGIINVTEGPGPDAIVPDPEPSTEGPVNGIVYHHEEQQLEQQQQVAVMQLPPLYDIDLEKMHSDLFKGRYLTPQDFLDDIGKMVHNANARAFEDMERLYKAQAMFTAAQVSIQEFDPQFRLECERMAVRERRRRLSEGEEKRKEQGKGAAEEHGPGQVNGIRRSGRNNGQQPELSITDPVLLERRLKRQRSNEAGSDSHGSEEENHEAKRSKVIAHDEIDPLNMISPPQLRVHFETDVGVVQVPNQVSTQQDDDSGMAVDDTPSRKRTTGFDPMLLNPMPSPDTEPHPFNIGTLSSTPVPETVTIQVDVPVPDDQNPFLSSQPPPPSPPRSPAHIPVPPGPLPVTRSPTPMIIERAVTPLPDFHVNEELLGELHRRLHEDTHSLTIEELEQLRATCLGGVWRHRTDWNRDALVRELLELVREFVSEIAMSP